MQRYVALLRAINVGGHTVKMDRLRALFEALGLERVETFIASGNVIFHAPDEAATLERRIESHLAASLGFPVATFLRTPAELQSAADRAPFSVDEIERAHGLYIGFMGAEPDETARTRVAALGSDAHTLSVIGRELYWLARERMSDSKLTNAKLEKALGMQATLRNVTTVRQLASKYAD